MIKPFDVKHDGKQYRVTGTVDYGDKQELIMGDFYWVQITLDPDAENEWENQEMPARFAGYDEKGEKLWNFLNQDGEFNWYVKWIGANISQQAARIKELEEALQFYADEDNYKSTVMGLLCCMAIDSGRRARQALKGGEG